LDLGLIDHLIIEPAGGAHRNEAEAAAMLKHALVNQLDQLLQIDMDELLEKRYEKFRAIGQN